MSNTDPLKNRGSVQTLPKTEDQYRPYQKPGMNLCVRDGQAVSVSQGVTHSNAW